MNLHAMRMPAAVGIIAVIGVAAYFQLSSDSQGSPQFAPIATGGGAESDTAGAAAVVDLRLGDLRAPVPEIAAAERNPFRFKTGEAPMGAAPAVAGPAKDLPKDASETAGPAPPPGPSAPPPILLKFVGLVESTEASERVAVLSDSKGNVFYGKEGDIIDGRYRVLKIGVESAELAYVDGRGRQAMRLSGQ